MQERAPWYRSNRALARVLPFIIIGGALAQAGLTGTARDIGLGVTIALLVLFVAVVTANAARSRR